MIRLQIGYFMSFKLIFYVYEIWWTDDMQPVKICNTMNFLELNKYLFWWWMAPCVICNKSECSK